MLRFIINNGMVNMCDVQNSMEVMKREEVLMKRKEGWNFDYLFAR